MTIKMDATNLKAIMDVCGKHTAPPGSARSILTHINLRVYDDGRVVATAMDGYQMVQYFSSCEIIEPYDHPKTDHHDIMIDPVKVPKCVMVIITESPDTVTFDFGGSGKVIQTVISGEYIDYQRIMKQVLEKDISFRIAFNPKIIGSVLNDLAKDGKSVVMTFYDSLNGVVIDGENSRGFVLPIRMCDDQFVDHYCERFG